MRWGLQQWAMRGTLLAATIGCSGCHGDGLAFAHPKETTLEVVAPRLLFQEPAKGSEHAVERWFPDGGVRVEAIADEDGQGIIALEALPGGRVRAWPSFRPTFDHADRAALHVRAREASLENPVQLELGFHDETQRNRWWRVVELTDPDWQVIDTRLSELRYDRGTLPRWEDVASWGMTFRTAASLEVRSIELWQAGPDASPYLGVDDLRRDFSDETLIRQARRGPFVVLTDASQLDLDQVLDALERMQGHMQGRFPSLALPSEPVPLLIFSTEAGYRQFWREFSSSMGVDVQPLPQDDGYTWQGIATTWFSDRYGPVRPVYVHEASHALLERALGLDAQRSWLFEGLGNLDQLEVSKQELAPVYRQGLARSEIKMPMYELISGAPIPTSRYWQATLLLEWLLADPGRTAGLASAMEDMRLRGSADLGPLMERHFGIDLPEFSAAFWGWAWSTYARSPGT